MRLALMRHAKSSWKEATSTDHQRSLNARGRTDAPRVAKRLVELGWIPEQIVSSDAARTRETVTRMAPEWPTPVPTRFSGDLYLAGVLTILAEIHSTDAAVETLLLVGHNPGCEKALLWLTGEPLTMTTANVALLELAEPTGSDVGPGAAQLVDLIRPRDF